jgi:hypothetical protein
VNVFRLARGWLAADSQEIHAKGRQQFRQPPADRAKPDD